MSVEDRLRWGLDANARAFAPEGEQRLAEVRRRYRARTGVLAATAAATVAAIVVVVAATGFTLWGSDRVSPAPAPRPTQLTTAASVYTGPRIPDSSWRKVVTREQLVRAGADSAFLAENLGRADRLPVTLSFVGDVYSQSGRYPGGWSVGDAGTLDYAPDGRLVLTSTAPGCRGCVGSFTWRLQGERLRLGDLHGSADDPMTRAIIGGVWSRSGS